jgi:pyruvate/2-oxoglutarate dehydrogenase complex dihydrolipoamide dehydrogenase (E3) component
MASYDVIVIGSGPGGYVCAIRCAQLGLKTACVEGRETLGGTCLNIGCIPSKALLHASHQLHEAEHNFAKMGLKGKAPSVDWKQMQAYKDEVIGQNTKGIEFLFKKNKIDWLKGWGQIDPRGGQGQGGRRDARGEGHRRRQRVRALVPAGDRDRREGRRDLRPARCRWARCRRRWS